MNIHPHPASSYHPPCLTKQTPHLRSYPQVCLANLPANAALQSFFEQEQEEDEVEDEEKDQKENEEQQE